MLLNNEAFFKCEWDVLRTVLRNRTSFTTTSRKVHPYLKQHPQ
jgi:hypothetical protein